MKQTIYYLNDRNIPVTVYLYNLMENNKFITLEPASGDYITIDIEEGKVLFIKEWETGLILFSDIPLDDKLLITY